MIRSHQKCLLWCCLYSIWLCTNQRGNTAWLQLFFCNKGKVASPALFSFFNTTMEFYLQTRYCLVKMDEGKYFGSENGVNLAFRSNWTTFFMFFLRSCPWGLPCKKALCFRLVKIIVKVKHHFKHGCTLPMVYGPRAAVHVTIFSIEVSAISRIAEMLVLTL